MSDSSHQIKGLDQHKHLEFIQGTVSRFSQNSFLIKGWSVALIAVLFLLGIIPFSLTGSRQSFFLLAYVPAIMFWGLDGFLLWQRELYRKLYDEVRQKPEDEIDFSMDTTALKTAEGWREMMLSQPLYLFYGGLIVLVTIVIISFY